MCRYAARTGRDIVLPDARGDPRFNPKLDQDMACGITTSLMCVSVCLSVFVLMFIAPPLCQCTCFSRSLCVSLVRARSLSLSCSLSLCVCVFVCVRESKCAYLIAHPWRVLHSVTMLCIQSKAKSSTSLQHADIGNDNLPHSRVPNPVNPPPPPPFSLGMPWQEHTRLQNG